MIYLNKKLIYLSIFLVLALFLISSCKPEEKPVGVQPDSNKCIGKPCTIKYKYECTDQNDIFKPVNILETGECLVGCKCLISKMPKDAKTFALENNYKSCTYKGVETSSCG